MRPRSSRPDWRLAKTCIPAFPRWARSTPEALLLGPSPVNWRACPPADLGRKELLNLGPGPDPGCFGPSGRFQRTRAARERLATKEGRRRHARRAGIEGAISQGVRAFGLRRSRYRGLAKTHLQHVATAAAVNLERLAAWFRAVPRAATRTSRFAARAA